MQRLNNLGFAPLVIIIVVVAIAAVGVGGYFVLKTRVAVAPSPSPSPTGIVTSTPDETAGWKIYTNLKYGFEIKYPADWHFSTGTSNNTDGFFIRKFIEGPGSQIAILPKGEFDVDLPSNPTISQQTISNKQVVASRWQLESDKILVIYNFMDPIPNWIKCESGLKNCNRVHIQADNSTDFALLDQILSTFKFTR